MELLPQLILLDLDDQNSFGVRPSVRGGEMGLVAGAQRYHETISLITLTRSCFNLLMQ